MRQIVLDTETTGLEPREGHRLIEIGCVELIERRATRQHFHRYLQPDREIDAEAVQVHGITNAFLADKPRFAEVVEEFLHYIQGAELIIHNAAFDVGFLDHELGMWRPDAPRIADLCTVTDTLTLARRLHPGQRNSLDALCKRYGIDNAHRQLHGALLDAQILADVYLAMTGGQVTLSLGEDASGTSSASSGHAHGRISRDRAPLRVVRADHEVLAIHRARLESIAAANGGTCLWLEGTTEQP